MLHSTKSLIFCKYIFSLLTKWLCGLDLAQGGSLETPDLHESVGLRVN